MLLDRQELAILSLAFYGKSSTLIIDHKFVQQPGTALLSDVAVRNPELVVQHGLFLVLC